MKLYVAHNFDARLMLRERVLPQLKAMRIECTSTWITDDSHAESKNRIDSAITDLMDLQRADAILFFAEQYSERPGRGKYVELGYALGKGKRVFLFRESLNPGCIFYALPEIIRIESITELENYK